jgi:hypothetical protein
LVWTISFLVVRKLAGVNVLILGLVLPVVQLVAAVGHELDHGQQREASERTAEVLAGSFPGVFYKTTNTEAATPQNHTRKRARGAVGGHVPF